MDGRFFQKSLGLTNTLDYVTDGRLLEAMWTQHVALFIKPTPWCLMVLVKRENYAHHCLIPQKLAISDFILLLVSCKDMLKCMPFLAHLYKCRGRAIGLPLASMAAAVASAKCSSFYVMGKMLTGKLSCQGTGLVVVICFIFFLLLPYKFYVLGQIGLSKQCRPRSDCF